MENERARVEIRSFLEAINSYPVCFAEGRRVSFEEHRRQLAESDELARQAKAGVLS